MLRGPPPQELEIDSIRKPIPSRGIVRMSQSPTPNASPYPDLKNQVALVLGAGQSGNPKSKHWGNGAAIAKVLSTSGAKVIACDVNLDAAQQTASRIQASGGVCDAAQADVTSARDIQRVTDQVLTKYGDQTQPQNRLSQLPCRSPDHGRQGSGSIINNASIAGMRYLGKPQVAYASAKVAVMHFTKVTGVMYAGKGVRVNSVAPGMMYTPLLEMLGNSESDNDREVYRKITDHNVPSGVMGDAFDVANCVAFLASHSSRYITGQNLVVDGGLTSSTGTGGVPAPSPKL
ncbi:short chain type dehydrogenase [Penicillium alfredii]|uniref:Short chain type dehydrogenase n=1 Tax=Penicillium alfredii TaxID=1506179 RepID=A0A9W9FKK0_9EURO|nr:short chain type dehydrogenase [Penicillium alfredii]KAJ5101918.1 short chain type dehydrogenase [Penicillium alfredii]